MTSKSIQNQWEIHVKTILEKVMLEIMFDIPSQDNIRDVVITEGVVREGEPPETEPVCDYGVPG